MDQRQDQHGEKQEEPIRFDVERVEIDPQVRTSDRFQQGIQADRQVAHEHRQRKYCPGDSRAGTECSARLLCRGQKLFPGIVPLALGMDEANGGQLVQEVVDIDWFRVFRREPGFDGYGRITRSEHVENAHALPWKLIEVTLVCIAYDIGVALLQYREGNDEIWLSFRNGHRESSNKPDQSNPCTPATRLDRLFDSVERSPIFG